MVEQHDIISPLLPHRDNDARTTLLKCFDDFGSLRPRPALDASPKSLVTAAESTAYLPGLRFIDKEWF